MTPRRLRFAVVAAVLAAGGLAAWLLLRPSALDRVRADLDRTDPGWRFADVLAAREADQPPDADNAMLATQAAAKLLPAEFISWSDQAGGWRDRPPSPQLPADPQAEAAWRLSAEAVAAARRVKDLSRGGARFGVTADPYMILLPHADESARVA